MAHRKSTIFPILVFVIACCPAVVAAQFDAGVVLWRHHTDLAVTAARDFDGSNDLSDERAKDWDVNGSGLGLRLAYRFPTVFAVHGELGAAQVTVRDEDIGDPNLDVRSRGLDEGLYLGLGASAGDEIPGNERVFWAAGIDVQVFSSELNEDVATTWDYDETSIALAGVLGYQPSSLGIYGGVRFVGLDADLEETDRTNPPLEQVRRIEMERDSGVDLILGARVRSGYMVGFVEMGIVGTFSTATGLSLQF